MYKISMDKAMYIVDNTHSPVSISKFDSELYHLVLCMTKTNGQFWTTPWSREFHWKYNQTFSCLTVQLSVNVSLVSIFHEPHTCTSTVYCHVYCQQPPERYTQWFFLFFEYIVIYINNTIINILFPKDLKHINTISSTDSDFAQGPFIETSFMHNFHYCRQPSLWHSCEEPCKFVPGSKKKSSFRESTFHVMVIKAHKI